jgi:pimeloyl-ACP methyl ester carboxylesterase
MTCDLILAMGDNLSRAIVRPPRANYDPAEMPPSFTSQDGLTIKREPIEFRNSRNQRIIGSFYPSDDAATGNPCVIYLHGNASAQLEGLYVPFLVQKAGVHSLLLDLSGSGQSDGEFITLGFSERDDVRAACDFLKREKGVSRVILWGRSMGASLGLWCAGDRIPGVVGCIADSPYASVRKIVEDLGDRSFFLKVAARLLWGTIDRSVRRLTQIGIEDISLWDSIANAKVPALIIHGMSDDFIAVRQSREIIGRYGCPEKFLWTVHGDHASEREFGDYLLMVEFVLKVFALDVQYEESQFRPAAELNPEGMHYRNVAAMAQDL